ncbi:MAG: hypothetical protein IPN33_17780 [Saprospiraceae bacterium]|nr:hypothetical protein [Saprospiraceae bacterium]
MPYLLPMDAALAPKSSVFAAVYARNLRWSGAPARLFRLVLLALNTPITPYEAAGISTAPTLCVIFFPPN